MTADLTYPDFRSGTFDELLDGYRCREVRDGRRCHLYAEHDGSAQLRWCQYGTP